MRLAFVYDRVNKFGGAERVLLALHEIWPNAPLFTAVYDKQKAAWANVFKVIPSYLRYLPDLLRRDKLLPLLTPFAFESMNFGNFDVVLSITSAEAKAVVTKPETLHICYCLTPTRYLWSGFADYLHQPGADFFNPMVRAFMRICINYLRVSDYISSNRPDIYIAISDNVARRIKKYYKKDARVLYPPIDLTKFKPGVRKKSNNYYLIVSRLVPYKRIDYAISAFNKLGSNLYIIGTGIDESRLRRLASENIKFLGDLTDRELACYYQNCRALIFPGEEDFGLTAVEAQACGKPVIAFGNIGIKEIIIEGKTGLFYDTQSEDSLISALKIFKYNNYLPSECVYNAKRFSKLNFQRAMKESVEYYWQQHKSNI